MMQLITIILLPLTLILLAITFGSITVHQRAMRSMVGERDERAVSTAARALSSQIDLRLRELAGLASMLSSDNSGKSSPALSNADYLLQDFDNGLAILDPQGSFLSTHGDTSLWDSFSSDQTQWEKILDELMAQPGKLIVIKSPVKDAYVGLISSPIQAERLLIGAFSMNTLVESMLGEILPSPGQLSTLLVDQAGQVLYKAGDTLELSSNHPGISEALHGQTGTVYVKHNGDEHVTAYSPVPSAGWALITEESWEAVSTPTLRATQVAPLVLVPALLIMTLALWLGARQIIQPLRNLESKAARLAGGDFTSIQDPVGGIDEIQHLQVELVEMASKVQKAQRSLHGYIGSITAAQEEERHRLARELHDDTLQALIALKQRVQLAQLELQSSTRQEHPESAELDEIASLTEQTIENLRRLTRALRPIYLEDLGLVPALEMLARETGQGTGFLVEFQRQGTERRLDSSVELALYRMAQEALSNIARHAEANKVSMIIIFTPGSVRLQVEDNGVGFTLPENLAELSAKGHYGLLGLHERAELIGASLEIITSPGHGTNLSVTLTT
jgi:signal transduction histidine kinase